MSIRIGTPDSRRMMRQTSMPESSGSIRSRTTRSGRCSRNGGSASRAVGGGDDAEAVGVERLGERLAQGRLVVDDEDRAGHRCHRIGRIASAA